MEGSPPGSPAPGILQARTLEWVAISFSNAWKWKVKWKSLSRVRPSATPAYQAPPSMGFSRQEYWNGMPLPSPKAPLGPWNLSFQESREKLYRQREQHGQSPRDRRVWDAEWRWICKQFIVAGVWGPKVLRAGGFREMKTSSGVEKTWKPPWEI